MVWCHLEYGGVVTRCREMSVVASECKAGAELLLAFQLDNATPDLLQQHRSTVVLSVAENC